MKTSLADKVLSTIRKNGPATSGELFVEFNGAYKRNALTMCMTRLDDDGFLKRAGKLQGKNGRPSYIFELNN